MSGLPKWWSEEPGKCSAPKATIKLDKTVKKSTILGLRKLKAYRKLKSIYLRNTTKPLLRTM